MKPRVMIIGLTQPLPVSTSEGSKIKS